MTRKRIPSGDRRNSILLAARRVFAEQGFHGAKTQQIAAAAGVSEALVFRHFPTKRSLYEAVLTHLVREQDESFQTTSLPAPSSQGLMESIATYLDASVHPASRNQREAMRILMSSLVGDGSYARFVFERAKPVIDGPVRLATAAARAAGDVRGADIDPINAAFFVAHLGMVLAATTGQRTRPIPYQGTTDVLLRDALRFCLRGLGVTEAALRRYERGATTEAARPAQRSVTGQRKK